MHIIEMYVKLAVRSLRKHGHVLIAITVCILVVQLLMQSWHEHHLLSLITSSNSPSAATLLWKANSDRCAKHYSDKVRVAIRAPTPGLSKEVSNGPAASSDPGNFKIKDIISPPHSDSSSSYNEFPADSLMPSYNSGAGRSLLASHATADANSLNENHRPAALIRCDNQTRCLSPVLQVKKKFKIYFCRHRGHGVRFYFLMREGLLLHPYVDLVSNPNDADYVFYLPVSADWSKTECNNINIMQKMVVLDEGDYPQLFQPDNINSIWERYPDLAAKKTFYYLYFKRSCVKRQAGKFLQYMNYFNTHSSVFPMTYTIMESYVSNTFTKLNARDFDLVCTLRGSKHDPARLRVQEWVQEYGETRKLKKFTAGQLNHASRTVVDATYFGSMHRAQVIVSCNPSHWEGDFRFMEAMASGALVFVDKMHTPRWSPLIQDKHVVYYDNENKTAFFEKLDYYRQHVQTARRVAVGGYLHAMHHHRAANLVDYVLRTMDYKRQYEEWHDQQHSSGAHPAPAADESGNHLEELIIHRTHHHNQNSSSEGDGTGSAVAHAPTLPGTSAAAVFHSPYSETGYDMKRYILGEMKRMAKEKRDNRVRAPGHL